MPFFSAADRARVANIPMRELTLMFLHLASLTVWGIWVGIDNEEISVYAPLRHNIVSYEHGHVYHWQIKYFWIAPSCLLALFHFMHAVFRTDYENIKTEAGTSLDTARRGVINSASTSGIRSIANGFATILVLNSLGADSLWFLGAGAVIVMMTGNVQHHVEKENDFNLSRFSDALYNIATAHTGLLFILAYMIVVFIQVEDDRPCFWHNVHWGLLMVWGFFNGIRLVWVTATGTDLINPLVNLFDSVTPIITAHHFFEWAYHFTLLMLGTAVLSVTHLDCYSRPALP